MTAFLKRFLKPDFLKYAGYGVVSYLLAVGITTLLTNGLHLDRKLSERRIFPAMDIKRSGTRKEELLMGPDELEVVWLLRRATNNMESDKVLEMLIDRLKKTKSNREFLTYIQKELQRTTG